jgi:hypothetical protein
MIHNVKRTMEAVVADQLGKLEKLRQQSNAIAKTMMQTKTEEMYEIGGLAREALDYEIEELTNEIGRIMYGLYVQEAYDNDEAAS